MYACFALCSCRCLCDWPIFPRHFPAKYLKRTSCNPQKERACVALVSTAMGEYRLQQSYVLLTVHPCIISQINPTRYTILFNLFIYFSSLHVSGIHVPIIRGKLFISMGHWYLTLCMGRVWSVGWIFNPTSRPDATHTEWQILVSHRYSSFLPMMSTWMTETCREEK